MKLKKTMGVVVDQLFYYDGREYSTDETLISFTKSFYIYFEKIIFIARVIPGKGPYPLDPAHFDVIRLPYYSSLYEAYRHYPAIRRATQNIFKNNIHSIDIFWLRGPHPVSLWMADLCRKHGKPYFLMVGQNLYEQVDKKAPSLNKILALIYITWLEKHFRGHAKTCLTFSVGRELHTKYSNGNNTVISITSSLIDKATILRSIESHKNESKTNQAWTSLITVGRIEPEKGHKVLIGALSLLVKEDARFFLKIVGTGKAEGHERRYVEDSGLSDNIEFCGYVPFGPELESLYQSTDVFVLPSLSEGFPRVILEAMSYGLPVVATRVGGIPFMLTDEQDSLLVAPRSSGQIAQAIIRLQDDGLRDKLITNGFKTALGLTAESQRDRMYNAIINYFPHLNQ